MDDKTLIILGLILILIVGFIVYILSRLYKFNKFVKNQKEINNQNVKIINSLKSEYSNKFQKHKSNYKLNERDINEITEAVLYYIRLDEDEKNLAEQPMIKQQNPENKQEVSNVKYPPSLTKTGFPDNLSYDQKDSYFRFFNIEVDKANFDFCGTDIERAIANKVEIEQACEIVSLGSDSKPNEVENLEKGTVTLRDGKWEVIKKAKINFK